MRQSVKPVGARPDVVPRAWCTAHHQLMLRSQFGCGCEGLLTAETVAPGLERRLKAELTGEVMFDRFTRGRYATDASHYQMMPLGVIAPRTIEEANRAIEIAKHEGVCVTARGGGTSQ